MCDGLFGEVMCYHITKYVRPSKHQNVYNSMLAISNTLQCYCLEILHGWESCGEQAMYDVIGSDSSDTEVRGQEIVPHSDACLRTFAMFFC